jgi:hypothetical protein
MARFPWFFKRYAQTLPRVALPRDLPPTAAPAIAVLAGTAEVACGDLDLAPAVVITGVPWRTGWRYRERGYRHVYWDAGTMLAQLLAAAGSARPPG